jgi:hypothetical protein
VRQRLLTSLFVLALVVSAFAGSVVPAGADAPKYSGIEWIFFPRVPNGEIMDETGPWYGTVTVQNLEDEPIVISAQRPRAVEEGSSDH